MPDEQNQKGPKIGEFLAMHGAAVFGKLADRFGISAAILVFIVITVKLLGNTDTQDDFVRELLFQDVTHKPWWQLFVGYLVFNVLLFPAAWWVRTRNESKEMQRIASEKSKLQAQLLGADLHHSEEEQRAAESVRPSAPKQLSASKHQKSGRK